MTELDVEASRQAAARIAGHVVRTPLHTNLDFNEKIGRTVYFKLENLQKIGAYKLRGATNAVLSIPKEDLHKGVITHSSGNHGQAIAAAAAAVGIPCTVIVPKNTAEIKIELIRSRGATIVFCEPTTESRISICNEEQKKTGATLIPPYDDENVIAGQGTIALEILEEISDIDAILIPTSGGGLLSGVSRVAKGLSPHVKIYAVEPQGKNLEVALSTNTRVLDPALNQVDTIADGTRTVPLGELTFPIARKNVEPVVLSVRDDDIRRAMRFAFEKLKLVIEPSGCLGIAALMTNQIDRMDPNIKKIVVVCSGGNVGLDQFMSLVNGVTA